MTRFKLLIFFIISGISISVLVCFLLKNAPTEQEIIAEQIIQSFMDEKGIDIDPRTEEYKIFMRRIVWGEFPELTGKNSIFAKNQDELDYVNDYAWKFSGFKALYGGYDEIDVEEASPTDVDE